MPALFFLYLKLFGLDRRRQDPLSPEWKST